MSEQVTDTDFARKQIKEALRSQIMVKAACLHYGTPYIPRAYIDQLVWCEVHYKPSHLRN